MFNCVSATDDGDIGLHPTDVFSEITHTGDGFHPVGTGVLSHRMGTGFCFVGTDVLSHRMGAGFCFVGTDVLGGPLSLHFFEGEVDCERTANKTVGLSQ